MTVLDESSAVSNLNSHSKLFLYERSVHICFTGLSHVLEKMENQQNIFRLLEMSWNFKYVGNILEKFGNVREKSRNLFWKRNVQAL